VFALGAVGAAPLRLEVAGAPAVTMQCFDVMSAHSSVETLSVRGRGRDVKVAI